MVGEPGLYVIVLNWNGGDVVSSCIESLEAVTNPSLDIIVVDNASTDSSPDSIRREFPGVELVVNDRNLLYAGGNNVGLRKAMDHGGRYFLLLNNDTEVDPDFAARMLSVFEREEEAGIVGPKILYYDDPERIWYGGGGFYPLLFVPRHRNIRRLSGTFNEEGGETEFVTGCALMVRREVLDEIGLLDTSYGIYNEDVDFCLRAGAAGWKCFYEPSALVWHKVSSSSGGGMSPFKLENRLVSNIKLHSRFRPRWWRVLLFPLHLMSFVVLSAGLLLSGRWRLFGGLLRGASRITGSG